MSFFAQTAISQVNFNRGEVWYPELSIDKVSFSDDGRIYFIYDDHKKLAFYELGGDTTDLTKAFNEIGINSFVDLIIDTTSVIIAGSGGHLAVYYNERARIDENFEVLGVGSITSLAFNRFIKKTIDGQKIATYITVATDNGLYYNYDKIPEFIKFGKDDFSGGFSYDGRSFIFRDRLLEIYNDSRTNTFRNCFNERNTQIQTPSGSVFLNSYSDTVRTNDLLSLRNGFLIETPYLYIASDQGLIYRSWGCNETAQNILIEGKITKLDLFNPFQAILPFEESDPYFFAGTDDGLYVSASDGNRIRPNFRDFNLMSNTDGTRYSDFTFNYCAGELYAATNSGIVQIRSFDNKSFIPFIGDKINPNGIIEICEGDTLQIESGLFDNFELQWLQNGDTIPNETGLSYSVTKSGVYSFAVNNCFFEQAQFSNEVKVVPNEKVNFDWNNPDSLNICQPNDTLFLSTEEGNAIVWYRNGTELDSHTTFLIVDEPGDYNAEIFNCNLFSISSPMVNVEFNALKKPIIGKAGGVVCESDFGQISLSNYHGGDITWYLNGKILDSIANRTQLYTSTPGEYVVKVHNDFCEALSDTLIFEVIPNPTYELQSDDYFCVEASVDIKLATDKSNNLQINGATYTGSLEIDVETELLLNLTGPEGCITRDTISIFERGLPFLPILKDTVYCFGRLEPFIISGLNSQNQYLLDGNSITGELVIREPSEIDVSVIDQFGCINEISVNVLDNCPDLMIPNVFTPNKDGFNDTFEIVNILPGTKLTVLDRNGKVIYTSDNYQNDWSSENNSSGTYYFYLKNNFYNLDYKGYIQVIK